MNRRSSAGVAAGAAALTVLLVLGIPLSASAASWNTYFNGQTSQNQTISTSNRSMNGGDVTTPVVLPEVRITQVGVGSQQAYRHAEVTHATMTTQSYCQWKYSSPTPGTTWGIQCRYRL